MASEQGMSGIDVKAMTSELCESCRSGSTRSTSSTPGTLGIRLNGENKARNLLLIESGRRTHLVKEFPAPPKNPPQYAMLLRKYLSGGKVLAIHQHGLERILIFDIGKGTTVYRLIIELFDEGNVILTNEEYKIVKPLRHHRFKEREIVPNAVYELTAIDPTASLENLTAVLKSEERDLVRALAMGCMLGGAYAEYICQKAGLEKTMPAASADPNLLFTAIQEFFDQVLHARTPVISAKHCESVDIRGDTDQKTFLSFSEALEAFYPLTKKEKATKAAKPRFSKEERIRKYQESAIKKFDEKVAKTEEVVAAIYENYQFISQLITSLDAASKQLSWQEIERHLKGASSPDAKKITAFYPDEAAVEVDIGKRVKIYVHEGIEQNAGRYYDVIKKFRKKKTGALAAMKNVVVKKKEQRRDFIPLKKLWYHRFRWFITSDGIVVLGGRDASQNEELVKKYMAGGDLFVHADVHGASVVIVKGKTEHMDEVAQFAASYSGAWRSGHFSADVFSVLPPQVSKTPESGEFVSRGSFIVRGERTWYRNVPLSVGIGLMLEPNTAVIGGPPSVIRPKCKAFSELSPASSNRMILQRRCSGS